MSREQRVLEALADGTFHSGETLAHALGVSRSAVWKIVRGLQTRGFELHCVRGRGYRLVGSVEPLAAEAIRAAIDPAASPLLASIEVLPSVDSTNTVLGQRAKSGAVSGTVCLAEAQTAGRGRSGRTWQSPAGANLYLSLLWCFDFAPTQLSGLSLAVGVAVVRALTRLGAEGLGLKWPNDVLARGRKLGGILLEFGGEAGGPCHVVLGIGINVRMPARAAAAIEQPWVDLWTLLGAPVSRNGLAGVLLSELALACHRFGEAGFPAFSDEWHALDVTAGRAVRLVWPGQSIEGIARGVDGSGALLLESEGRRRSFAIGEVSLRVNP